MEFDNLHNIEEAIQKVAAEAVRVIQYVMESERGINDKVNINTLVDSDIYSDIDVNIEDLSIINILVNSYIDSIESGRKAGAKRVPIDALIIWCNKKGIQADNGVVYAIQESIYKYGISPRPIFDMVYNIWDEHFSKYWADEIFNEIIEPIRDFFNN